ncbi:hypothetical protein FRC09_011018 [Ceratobasidium sp. 395]|nr:hypothetical protein FRC09_011018 [Ceratobasidium sp. 395]
MSRRLAEDYLTPNHPPFKLQTQEASIATCTPNSGTSTMRLDRRSSSMVENVDDTNGELAICANIWSAYLHEALERDSKMYDAWHKTLDVLLILQSVYYAPSRTRYDAEPGHNATLTAPDDILAFSSPAGA